MPVCRKSLNRILMAGRKQELITKLVVNSASDRARRLFDEALCTTCSSASTAAEAAQALSIVGSELERLRATRQAPPPAETHVLESVLPAAPSPLVFDCLRQMGYGSAAGTQERNLCGRHLQV